MKYLCDLLIVIASSAIAANFKNDMSYLVGKHPYIAIQTNLLYKLFQITFPKKTSKSLKTDCL